MPLEYEQVKEVEALVERRLDLLDRVNKLATRLSVLENKVVVNDRYSQDMRVQTGLILVAIAEGLVAILLWFLS